MRQPHEYEIADLQVGASNGHAQSQLLGGSTRHANACGGGRVEHQAAAVEAARLRAAESIRLTEHGGRAVNHQGALIRGGWLRSRRAWLRGCCRRQRNFVRRGRACAEHDRCCGGEDCPDQVRFREPRVVANAAPTIPASARIAPMHRRASQCSLSMNFSGSPVMPPHSTMRSGHNNACSSFNTKFNSPAQLSQLKLPATLARPDARFSASSPTTCRWPSSVFGTNSPLTNRALPMPVPRVSTRMVPETSRAAP